MKIAFVSQPWESLCQPLSAAIEIQTFGAARRLARTCEVLVYARGWPGQPRVEWSENVQIRRFQSMHEHRILQPLEPILFPNIKRPYFASWLYHYSYAHRVARDLSRQRCAVIHVQSFHQIAALIQRLNPWSKVILHMHCDWLPHLSSSMLYPRLRTLSGIIGNSEFISTKIRRAFPTLENRCHTVYYGIDVAAFQAPGPASQEGATRQRILYVGRISPEKGIHVLVDAFCQVAQQFPNAELIIAGQDSIVNARMLAALYGDDSRATALRSIDSTTYRQRLYAAMPDHVRNRIHFAGTIPNTDLPSHYQESDVFVFPSECHEGFGIPVVEAMASGLPVVATRSGGVVESIEHGRSGFLVERGDSRSLAEALCLLLQNPDLRFTMGCHGQQRAWNFSWERTTGALLKLYESVQGNTQPLLQRSGSSPRDLPMTG